MPLDDNPPKSIEKSVPVAVSYADISKVWYPTVSEPFFIKFKAPLTASVYAEGAVEVLPRRNLELKYLSVSKAISPPTVRKFAVSATSLIDFLEPISLDEGVYLESEETVPCQSPNRLIEDVMCISRGTYAVTLFTVLMLG